MKRNRFLDDKIHAAELRQRDIGWGWALASILSYPVMYHSSTRKSLTPFAAWFGCFVVWFATSPIVKNDLYVFALFAAMPVSYKAASDWDRKRSKAWLRSDEVVKYRKEMNR